MKKPKLCFPNKDAIGLSIARIDLIEFPEIKQWYHFLIFTDGTFRVIMPSKKAGLMFKELAIKYKLFSNPEDVAWNYEAHNPKNDNERANKAILPQKGIKYQNEIKVA